MTVRELIEELKEYDPDLTVQIAACYTEGEFCGGDIRFIDHEGSILTLINEDPLIDSGEDECYGKEA